MNRHDFESYVIHKSLYAEITDLAHTMLEAYSHGIDVEQYLDLLVENQGIGQRIGQTAGSTIGRAGDAATKGLGRLANAAVSAVGGGLARGGQRAARAFTHGQAANNASFQLKDAMSNIDAAIRELNKLGQPGSVIANRLNNARMQLQNDIQAAIAAEKEMANKVPTDLGPENIIEPDAQGQRDDIKFTSPVRNT